MSETAPDSSQARRALRRIATIAQIIAFWFSAALATLCLVLKVRGFAWYLDACQPRETQGDVLLISDCGRFLNMIPDWGLTLSFLVMALALPLLCVLRRWRSAGRMGVVLAFAIGANAALEAWFKLQLT